MRNLILCEISSLIWYAWTDDISKMKIKSQTYSSKTTNLTVGNCMYCIFQFIVVEMGTKYESRKNKT